MKVVIKSSLVKRLDAAKENGSKIAREILALLEKNAEGEDVLLPECKSNYFGVSKGTTPNGEFSVVCSHVTCCSKDVNNENFPDRGNEEAPWFPENRQKIKYHKFALLFERINEMVNEGSFTPEDIDFFNNAMLFGKKVNVYICSSMSDFERAYNKDNYCQLSGADQSNLHSSCMRHEHTSRNAADFYANFCGTKIMIAEDEDGNILGRAIVWDGAKVSLGEQTINISFIDRMYFCFDFVRSMMMDCAKGLGINLRKAQNTYDSQNDFVVLTPFFGLEQGGEFFANVEYPITDVSRFKTGCPYMDTMKWLRSDGNGLVLSNYSNDALAVMTKTNGYAKKLSGICPICRKPSNSDICPECEEKYLKDTVIGKQYIFGYRLHNGRYYPDPCFDENGDLRADALALLRIESLYS